MSVKGKVCDSVYGKNKQPHLGKPWFSGQMVRMVGGGGGVFLANGDLWIKSMALVEKVRVDGVMVS